MSYQHELTDEKKKPEWKAIVTIKVPPHHERKAECLKLGTHRLEGLGKSATDEGKIEWYEKNGPILFACYEKIRPLIEKVEITGPKGEKLEGLEALETHPAFDNACVELGYLYAAGFGPGKK